MKTELEKYIQFRFSISGADKHKQFPIIKHPPTFIFI